MFILVSIWAVAANWLAYSKGFYRLPEYFDKETPRITNTQLFGVFALYFLLSVVAVRFFMAYLLSSLRQANPDLTVLPISVQTGIQFFMLAFLAFLMQWFIFKQDKLAFGKLWKDKNQSPSSIAKDFGIGAFTWILSFPIVTVIGNMIDTALKSLIQFEPFEQNAVKFVKVAIKSSLSFTFAFLCVLILAPLVEEFLFRGVLQTYFKKRVGPKAAILLSALIFALFHYSIGHGLSNVSLILSLMILGTFLGFLYERQRSLWAPLGLHIAFNAISALRILFSSELS